jgi:CRP-like cAMP-binding protein
MNSTAETIWGCPTRTPDCFDQTLNEISVGKRVLDFRKNQTVFSQGDAADSLYFIQRGKVKLVVVSFGGKEATLAVMGPKTFFGRQWGAAFEHCDNSRIVRDHSS